MKKASALAKNTFYLTLAMIGQKVIAFLYFALIARYMGAGDTGAYFLALAVVTVLTVLDDVGVTSVLIREVAKKTNDAKVWCRTVMGVKVVTVPLMILMAFLVPSVFGYEDGVAKLIQLALIVMVADSFTISWYGVLRGLQKLKFEALGVFVGQILIAAVGVGWLLTGTATLPILILALAAGSVWNMCFSGFWIARHLGLGAFVPGYAMGWKPLKMAFAFFLAAVFVKVYSYVDSLILSMELGNDAVGRYAVAYKLTYAFQFFPLAFVGALYPAMSSCARDKERLKHVFLQALWYLAIIGFPIVFGIWAMAPEIIGLFYGADYSASVLPLQILIFVLLFLFLDFPIGSLLNACDRQGTKTAIMGGTMVVNVVANLMLIPMYGVEGAAIAGLISFAFLFFAGWVFMQSVVRVTMVDLWRSVGMVLLISILMAVCVVLVKAWVHMLVAIGVGAVLYALLLVLCGVVRKEHLALFMSIVKPSYEARISSDV